MGVDGVNPQLLAVKGKKDRDPRYHMISVFYLVEVADDAVLTAQDDAASAEWYDLASVITTPEKWAFDHHSVLVELTQKNPEYAIYKPK